MNYELHLGDNREVLRSMPSDSVDSIVCDPPYELGFMGKKWDSTGIAYDVTLWAECLRVLKPGGHLLALGGSRTYHRLAVAIEDAGFEIRDCIMWLYASGFPKSLAVDKAIDRQRDDREQTETVVAWLEKTRQQSGVTRRQVEERFGTVNISQSWFTSTPGMRPRVPTLDQIPPLLALFGMTLDDVPDDVRTLIWTLNGRKGQPGEAWFQREVVGESTKARSTDTSIALPSNGETIYKSWNLTAPATPLAQQWQGWGTALKPAHEPIVVARKPLQGTVADNVQAWGVGALNIDGCRVGTEGGTKAVNYYSSARITYQGLMLSNDIEKINAGRWPANIILDEEAAQMLDEQSGWSVSSAHVKHNTGAPSVAKGKEYPRISIGHSDSGGASRFFYVAKASKTEREAGLQASNKSRANHHPTVKPIALMRYLVRMVTPRGGVVLDPFMGSGTTGCAAMLEAMHFIGIDITPEYKDIAERRIQHWASQNPMELSS